MFGYMGGSDGRSCTIRPTRAAYPISTASPTPIARTAAPRPTIRSDSVNVVNRSGRSRASGAATAGPAFGYTDYNVPLLVAHGHALGGRPVRRRIGYVSDRQLQRAEERRSMLDHAEKLLMTAYRCTDEQARGLLVAASDSERRLLMDVAGAVLDNSDDEWARSRRQSTRRRR